MTAIRRLIRILRRSPLFSLISVLTLAVGVAANVVIFALIHGILIKPLPFPESDRLVHLMHSAPGIAAGSGIIGVSQANYFAYIEENQTFENIALYRPTPLTVTGMEEAERVPGLLVTQRFLPLLGVRPHLGRFFNAEDDSPGATGTVILSHGYWERRFGSDPEVIGRRVRIDGTPRTIIGVLPDWFRFLNMETGLLIPFQLDRAEARMANFSQGAVGRLRPEVSLETAVGDLERILPLATEKFPRGLSLSFLREAQFRPVVEPLKKSVVGDIDQVLWILLGAVFIVLLVSCANVSNLLLVRAQDRQREMGLRTALGAGRMGICREIWGESLFLSALAGIVAVLLAEGARSALVRFAPAEIPRLNEVSIGGPVLIGTGLLCLAVGLALGLLPLMRALRIDLARALTDGGRTSSRPARSQQAQNLLVVAQIALTLTLLIASGLLIRSLDRLLKVDPGFENPEEVLTFRITVPEGEIAENNRVAQAHEGILQAVGQIPGVTAAGLTSTLPMANQGYYDDMVEVEEFPVPAGQNPPGRRFQWVSPSYFETLGVPLLAGRTFTWQDIQNASPVVLINEAMARIYWPDLRSAIGKRIRESLDDNPREIIGVVGNVRSEGLSFEVQPTIIWPTRVPDMWGQSQFTHRSMSYALRLERPDREAVIEELSNAVSGVSANLAISNISGLDAVVARSEAQRSFALGALAAAAALTLFLAVVGVYGVISYAVSLRTREIGIRMALGADRQRIERLVLRRGGALIGAGLLVGVVAGLALTRLMTGLLFQVQASDPLTYLVTTAILGAIALAASYAPAYRAARLAPLQALRG